MTSFLLGLFIGVVSIGAHTWRFVQVTHGKVFHTLIPSIAISIAYWFSVDFVVKQDLSSYIGFSVGAALVTMFIAYTERDKKHPPHGATVPLDHEE